MYVDYEELMMWNEDLSEEEAKKAARKINNDCYELEKKMVEENLNY